MLIDTDVPDDASELFVLSSTSESRMYFVEEPSIQEAACEDHLLSSVPLSSYNWFTTCGDSIWLGKR